MQYICTSDSTVFFLSDDNLHSKQKGQNPPPPKKKN